MSARSIKKHSQRGFTLVEMIVAVALFAVVILICVGALLSLVDANRKAQSLQSVVNNLNIAVDSMTRSIRTGTNYRCGSGGACPNGAGSIAFTPFHDPGAAAPSDWQYRREVINGIGRICKTEAGAGSACIPVTAPEVNIESMTFYVNDVTRGNVVQPKVVIVIKGIAGTAKPVTRTNFHIQATAVQRLLDL